MIITLCGSARFEKLFREWDERLTFAGHVVFNLAVYPSDKEGEKEWYTPGDKQYLDLIHLRKIQISDAIVVLDKDGYIGESTRNEMNWARMLGKKMYFLERFKGTRADVLDLVNSVGGYRDAL